MKYSQKGKYTNTFLLLAICFCREMYLYSNRITKYKNVQVYTKKTNGKRLVKSWLMEKRKICVAILEQNNTEFRDVYRKILCFDNEFKNLTAAQGHSRWRVFISSAATTEESTPPDRANDTLRLPTWLSDRHGSVGNQ